MDLTAALHTVVGRGQLAVDVSTEDTPLVPASVALAFVRAVREALANVERHAEVGTAVLSVRGEGDRVVVTVADRGVGFHPDEVTRSRRGIRARWSSAWSPSAAAPRSPHVPVRVPP